MSIIRQGVFFASLCALLFYGNGALAAADAEIYATGMLSSLSTQRVFRDALPSTADYTQTAHRQTVENYCGPIAGSICQPGSKWVMWDTPFLQFDSMRRNDGHPGYDYDARGFATGVTRLIGEHAAIGLAVGYDAREQKGRDGNSWKLKGDAFHTALYGGINLDSFFFDAYAGFSWASLRAHRAFEANNDILGNYNDTILSSGFKASYVWALPRETRIMPSIGFDYSRVHINSARETGGNAGNLLLTDSAAYNSFQLPIMIAANKTFSNGFLSFGGPDSLWTPEVRGGWVPQFGKSYADVTARLQADQDALFNSKSAKINNSYGVVGAGLKIQIRDTFIFALDYDYRFGDKYSSHVITGTYGVSF